MLADELQARLKAEGLAVQAAHVCIHWRGVRDTESSLTTSAMRGAFLTNAGLRGEFLSIVSTSLQP